MTFTVENKDGGLISIPDNAIIIYEGLQIQGDNLPDWNEPIQQNAVKTINRVISAETTIANLDTRVSNLTKANVGLGNVDNTSDANKPISIAEQTALNLKANVLTTYTKTEVDTLIVPLTSATAANISALIA